MTVGELMEILGDLDPSASIRLATQPSWPMEYGVQTVVSVECDGDDEPGVVYLAEGDHVGYLPSGVSEEAWA